MTRILLASLFALLAACAVDETSTMGERCSQDSPCAVGSCYRGFCVSDTVDLGATDMRIDASDSGDVDAGDVDSGDVDAGTPDAGPPPDLGPPMCVPDCGGLRPDCCGTDCVDVMNDANNCGACGHHCSGSESCMDGLCCATGLVSCGGACVPLHTMTNCGHCGDACSGANVCCASATSGGAFGCRLLGLCL